MSRPSVLRALGAGIARYLYANLPLPEVSRPVFIIGCGRSGTTILGTALSKHRQITYLNEPRHLWYYAYPETGIWMAQADSRKGRLWLEGADAEPGKSRKIRRLFHFETLLDGRPVLIEKLPVNSFRLEFLLRIFPDVRFIHLYRNGLEVARSIGELSEAGVWYGEGDYKWRKLVEYAARREDTQDLPALCASHFDRGLLEWRLSVEAITEFLCRLPKEAFFELDYESLLGQSVETLSQVLSFIGLEHDPDVTDFVSEYLARKSDRLGQDDISEKTRLIGGRLLPLSMAPGGGLSSISNFHTGLSARFL